MKNLVIIGAGDLGKEIVWLIEDINKVKPTYVILGFLDDDLGKSEREFFGYKVLGVTKQLSEINKKNPVSAVIAIQDGVARKRIVTDNPEFDNWENIIHPTAVIADSTILGKGNVFFPQTAVSVDCRLGDFGLYYLHASVGNDCLVGDYVSVMLNTSISEHVKVEALSYLAADKHIPPHSSYKNEPVKRIVLIGAGGFGRETATIIEEINKRKPTYELLGFLDDGEQFAEGSIINGYPWLGGHVWALSHKDNVVYTCVIGNTQVRAKIQRELMNQGVQFETLVAVGAFISPYTEIGKGCVFYSGVMISVNCTIGDGVLLNTRVNIGHDVEIGEYTTISPNTSISGECHIGEKVIIGGHAFINIGRKIGDNATIAAGSIVFTNVKPETTVLGNPAKRMKGIED